MTTETTLEHNPNDPHWERRTKAYRNGYMARIAGQSKAAQPHGKATLVASHWLMGWRASDLVIWKAK